MNLYPCYTLQRKLKLPITIEEGWSYFSNPANLREITPDWLRLTITSQAGTDMYAGMIVCYRIHPFPATSLNWVTEITHAEPPHLFVDEQRCGPYRFWHHQHHLREIPDGIEVEDLVHYVLPLGPVGYFAHKVLVKRQLEEIFNFREKALRARFGIYNDLDHAMPESMSNSLLKEDLI